MQISCRCGKCSFRYLNDDESDLAIEFDFYEQEIKWICRKCKKENKISFEDKRKTMPLPSTIIARG